MDVDRLTIVTFTEAAAAEMKRTDPGSDRKSVGGRSGNVNLQRQATLIHSAPITTIHSFCLSVIRDHFHVIDIDQDSGSQKRENLKLLETGCTRRILEACYADGAEEFRNGGKVRRRKKR